MQGKVLFRLVGIALILTMLLAVSAPVSAVGSPTDMILEVIKGPVSLRDRPSQSGATVQTLGTGARMAWGGVYRQAEGRNWMQVITTAGTGWASPDNEVLRLADPTHITPLMDRSVVFEPSSSALNLYQSPALASTVVVQVPAKSQLTVTDGPALADLYTWWQVKTADGHTGWLPDSFASALQVTSPLRVYGYAVCDSFNLKTFGVPGWDSIVDSLSYLIPAGEQIVCLASTNLRGDNTPTVVILSRTADPKDPHDTLRIFGNQASNWFKLYEQTTNPFARTERVSLHDLTGDGKLSLLWAVRADGTGGVLSIDVFRYAPSAGIQRILSSGGYKGQFQVGASSVVVIEAAYQQGEPNCCPSGIHRLAYVWQNNQFTQVADDAFLNPYWMQGTSQ